MKSIKFLFSAFFVVLFFAANAQLEMGKYTLGVGYDLNPDFSATGISLSSVENYVEFGYFVKDKWEAGISGNIENGRGNLLKRDNYNLGAYSKYYFRGEKRFNPFIGAFLGGGKSLLVSDHELLNFKKAYLKASVDVGLVYWMNKKIALTGNVRYSINEFFNNGGVDNSGFEFRAGAKYNF